MPDYWDEVGVIILIPFLIKGLIYHFREYNVIAKYFYIYMCFSIISAFWYFSPMKAVLLQLVLESKLIIYFYLFSVLSMKEHEKLITRFYKTIKVILILSLPILIMQLFFPGIYYSIFSYGADNASFKLMGFSIPRGTGLFWFSGQLAVFSSIAVVVFFSEFLISNNSKRWLFLSSLVLLCTFQRFEILLTLISISGLYMLSGKCKSILMKSVIVSIVLLCAFIVFVPIFKYVYFEYKLYDVVDSDIARIVFYVKSLGIALVNFPLGSGLGTFGGRASVVYGYDLYEDLNFSTYWWFLEGKYLTDTFWPHILGESGFGGLLSLGIFYSLIFKVSFDLVSKDKCLINIICLGVVFIMLVNSLVSPNFYESISYVPMMLFFTFIFRRNLSFR
ncbi:hypothetical protein [Vibrio campbellii]|uniref:hypothetical protein n=1 Tax=Vibrio campbellii TaxID=680 RepID=UPI00126A34FA|nr:hypothetical protein [Vibrio campbellii]